MSKEQNQNVTEAVVSDINDLYDTYYQELKKIHASVCKISTSSFLDQVQIAEAKLKAVGQVKFLLVKHNILNSEELISSHVL